MIQKDIRDIRTNLTKYINKYNGRKIYISKYNRIIGELKFYSSKEKELAKLDIAKEIVKDSDADAELIWLAKSIIQMDINEIIKKNEIRALALLEMNEMGKAENCLNENLRIGTNSSLTYDLLIEVYSKKNDYQSLIKTLNNAVKYSDKKEIYRKFRKAIIFNKLMQDIDLSRR